MSNTMKTQRYDRLAMSLHWLIALLLIPMLFAGEELMENEGSGTFLPSVHVSIGLAVLVLSLIRLGWRFAHPAPPPPAGTAAWELTAARIAHALFYVLMIGLPVTGWLGLPHFLWEEPSLAGLTAFGLAVPVAPELGVPAGALHNIGSKVAIALLILHVAAALKHQFINRDEVLARMLPGAR
jgi:cytochrome b561